MRFAYIVGRSGNMIDFEEFARSQGFSGDFQRGCNGQYKSDLLHFMEKAFMHQQAKIYELQARVDEALKILDGMRHNGSYKAIDILKGNKYD